LKQIPKVLIRVSEKKKEQSVFTITKSWQVRPYQID